MKTKKYMIALIGLLIFQAFQISAQSIKKENKAKIKQSSEVDYRIDNMSYWMKKAEQGIVPYNPSIPVKPAKFNGSKLGVKGVLTINSVDIPVSNATNITESENSVFVDPSNPGYLLNSNNSTSWIGGSVGTIYGANYFQSSTAGLTWGGSAGGAGGSNSGDPTTAIGLSGRQYVNYIDNPGGQGIAYSDNGTSWSTATIAPNPGSLADKNHMWIDNVSTSPYQGNVYVAWTDFGGSYNYDVVLSRSTNNGASWSTRIPISGTISTFDHGVNLQTGPNGEVYACWATYPSSGITENGIGFTKSTNGGVSFSTPFKAISTIQGIRSIGVSKNMRVNSFPVMAVDVSGGSNNGNIYIVWSNYGDPNNGNSGTNISVYMIRSTNGGTSWSAPIRVNQGPTTNGKEAYFPWISCDPVTGVLSAVFYDDRNTSSTSCEAFAAYSLDAGNTWTDFVVSDVSFTPAPIPGLTSSYMGDYLGITSRAGKVYPCWTDTRNGLYMTYVSPFELGLSAQFTANNTNICSGSSVMFTDQTTGSPTSWSWAFPGGSPSSYTGQAPPAITYNTPGNYSVTLTVGDGATTDVLTKTNYITVQNIIADFSGTPTTVVVGNTVTFTDLSSCSPTSWNWSFPGGSPSSFSGQNPPAITYGTEGSYNVSLTVGNASGNDTKTATAYITVIPPEFNMQNGTVTACIGNFYDTGGPTGSYSNNETLTETFYPSTSGAMARFTFTSFSTETSYDYLYIYDGNSTAAPLIGTYNGTVGPGTVTATNAQGALTFKFTSDVSVTSTGWVAAISCYSTTLPPVANFTADVLAPVIGQTVSFTDQSSNNPTSWTWSFSGPGSVTYVGGTTSASQNPQVQFGSLGLYDAILNATNAYGSNSLTKPNYINVINCTYCASSGTTFNEEWISNVTLGTINNTTAAAPAAGYSDFTSQSTDISPGSSYNASVSCSSTGSWTENIFIFIDWNQDCDFADPGESYDLGQTVGPGTLNLSIPVPAGSMPGTTRMRVSLKYSTNPTPCEVFSYGEVEDYSINVLGGGAAPIADFSAGNTTPFVGSPVIFTDNSTNGPTTWSWSFSPATVTYLGGTNSSSQNPQLQFDAPGLYSVTLTAANAYGFDAMTKVDYILAYVGIPPYNDNYESFAAGNFLAVNSPYWTTWNNLPGTTEDNVIVSSPAHSGTKAVKVDGTTDLVLPLGDQVSGKYMIDFYMYVPAGNYGYYNLLQLVNGASSEWGIEVFFDAGGSGYGNAGGANSFTFTYPYNTWFEVRNIVDLDNDMAEVSINGNMLHQWQWSTGALGTGTLNQLGGLDMYAWNVNGIPLYYFDDLLYRELLPLDLTVMLEGPFNPVTGIMNTDLNANNLIPLTQPFNVAPWFYAGTESVVAIPSPNIVDWVLLDFRDATSAVNATAATSIGRKAAFLRNDGQVVDMANNPLVDFRFPYYNNLYVVVSHFNHLSVMSKTNLLPSAVSYPYNFSTGASQAYGGANAHKQLVSGIWGMFSGDGDKNGSVTLLDKSPLWESQSGNSGNLNTDYNLDSQSNNIDKDEYWEPNLGKGSQVPN